MTRLERKTLIVSLSVFFSLLLFIFLFPSSDTSGYFRSSEGEELKLSGGELNGIPQQVKEDAYKIAVELLGEDDNNLDRLAVNLCAIYDAAAAVDVLVVFNPGGYGWAVIGESSGWESIADEIGQLLTHNGYSSALIDYRRTNAGLMGLLGEATGTAGHLVTKGEDLMLMIDFISRHLPQTSIILVGESNGTVICDKVMRLLKDNSNIYTIQTGPPGWYITLDIDRSLVIRDNGLVPDAFSNADLISMIRANLETIFGIEREYEGDVFLYIGAPGHVYSWEYPNVKAEITEFINLHFS